MFRKHGRGLLDFLVSVLCLWVAAYHTPAGALARRFGAWAVDVRSTARPLLSYYEGGADDLYMPTDVQLPPQLAQLRGAVPEGAALGYGAWTAWQQLPAAERAPARDLARRYGADASRLDDPDQGPPELLKVLKAARVELGSDDAAMLAVMCGYEPARYARDRARAEGGPPDLGLLLRQLPPEFEGSGLRAASGLTLATAFGLSWPVSESAPITSGFGMRDHPILGGKRMHTGVDISVPMGTAVHAVAAGTVRRASEDAINGKVLVIDHGRGVTTAYCHNSELLLPVGAKVERGEVIARSGTTGRSTGPHVHYQLALADSPVDPLKFRPLRPGSSAEIARGGADGRAPPPAPRRLTALPPARPPLAEDLR
ncbi:MAG TPA: M23 family metallopeptidase [Myxococcales bacterium]|jgi:murein DD-endopeptidase MepM/ murein hydrolase activator NlpD|nr:M23 family metallopeptidase [Myxococcales bacterium]